MTKRKLLAKIDLFSALAVNETNHLIKFRTAANHDLPHYHFSDGFRIGVNTAAGSLATSIGIATMTWERPVKAI